MYKRTKYYKPMNQFLYYIFRFCHFPYNMIKNNFFFAASKIYTNGLTINPYLTCRIQNPSMEFNAFPGYNTTMYLSSQDYWTPRKRNQILHSHRHHHKRWWKGAVILLHGMISVLKCIDDGYRFADTPEDVYSSLFLTAMHIG